MSVRFKPLMLLVVCLLISGIPAIQAYAQNEGGGEFLQKYSEAQRAWYYIGAFEAFGHVAALQNQQAGNCVWNWYASNPETRKIQIENTIRKYPDHTPTAIMIALLRKDCGVFNSK